jgi:hypothetical protein
MKRFPRRAGFAGLPAGIGILIATAVFLAFASEPASVPAITSIERRDEGLVIHATAPVGVSRLVLESCRRSDFHGWMPLAVTRISPSGGEVTFEVAAGAGFEMFRVRADLSEPIPASFYTGRTNFPGEPAADAGQWRGPADAAGPPVAESDDPSREIVESDIWVVGGDRLYFFNQFRGLQVIDISDPDAPELQGTLPLPGVGEQMYLLDDRYAVLLVHDPCGQWNLEAESAVVLVDTAAVPAEMGRQPIPGRIIESRLVGRALYVATETWKPAADGSGAWEAGTWVTSFDLGDPEEAVAREPLWFPGSGNVVTATDRFLFVAITDYSRNWPWKSDLQVVDISSPDGTMSAHATVPLPGRIPDKFKIDLSGDVLRVVVEATEVNSGRWVTVLETYRLADPRTAAEDRVVPLDRLELARGERLFATRFDGERGYIVTFERIDPLWVVDLSDPANLRITGELEIPGWSTYIRPLGDRLLTLGIDNISNWRVAVQLFDVSDPAKPSLLAKVPLGEDASWSEATHDEKAFGVFLDAGLLAVPISDWSGSASQQGVQLIDLGRDFLRLRGLLSSETLVPRRATLHRDRLISISGRELVSATIADRDQPSVSARLELAYPVERVLLAGENLLEFSGHSLRVRSLGSDEARGPAVHLGEFTLLGASVRDAHLHLLQGLAAQVSWEQDPVSGEWLGRTNPGVVVASTWDLSDLGNISKLGEARSETYHTWLSDMNALWLRDGLVVWATDDRQVIPWWQWGGPVPFEDIAGGVRLAPAADLWMPWWYGAPPWLIAVIISASGQPEIASQTLLGTGGDSAGAIHAAEALVFSARRHVESEVVGTNVVIESIWFPGDSDASSGGGVGPDGEKIDDRPGDGEWRQVTNHYPVVRWWSRFELDVTDFSQDPRSPARRLPLPLPGELAGVSHQGAMLYTTATRMADGKQTEEVWLEASAYDGVSVHLVDSIRIADYGASQSFAAAVFGGAACVARGGWETDADQRMETWRVSDAGRWEQVDSAALSAAPGELHLFNDLLMARNGGAIDLFLLNAAGSLEALSASPVPGCFGGSLGRGDGDSARGVWLPFGDYGALRVGPLGGAGDRFPPGGGGLSRFRPWEGPLLSSRTPLAQSGEFEQIIRSPGL